jgi:hypothetical protein
MNEPTQKRLYHLITLVEKDLEQLKSELLMAMVLEQSELVKIKYDRTNYFKHPLK